MDEHTRRIKNRYEQQLERHDKNSPEAVHWVDEDRVRLRYDVLTGIGNLSGKKILDFGCGTGLFLDYLNDQNVNCEYHGWDISETMIKTAKDRHPNANFSTVNVLNDDGNSEAFDYAFVSGVFHVKTGSDPEEHRKWMYAILKELWKRCDKGISVNFMTEHVDWKDDDLYYCDLDDLVEFCVDELSRWFTLRRDYKLWEHTLYVFTEAQQTP